MDDLISRQAAIDALCAVCGKACDKSKFVYNASQDEQVILCPEHYCLCTLPSAQPEQRWIPCSERLPEEHEEVLTYDSVFGITFDSIRNGKWRKQPVAWIPLPEPYKGGEEE